MYVFNGVEMKKTISYLDLLLLFFLVKYLFRQYLDFCNINSLLVIFILLFIINLFSDLKLKKPKEEPFKKKEIFFISLLAIYQPLYFYAHNIVEINYILGLSLCLFVYLQFILLICLTNVYFKDKNKSLFTALIFSFLILNLHRNELLIYIITALLLWSISKVSLIKIKKPVMVFTAVLLLLTAFEFGNNYFKIIMSNFVQDTSDYETILPHIKQGTKNRDVYIVLLDRYGGTNTLKQKFGFDNSDFINELKQQGFYVFDKMYSNYDLTFASIPSILNLEYFENLNFGNSNSAIEDATLYKIAKIKGYKTAFIKNPFFSLKTSKYLDYVQEEQKLYLNDILHIFFGTGVYRDIVESSKFINLFKTKETNTLNLIGKKFVFMHMLLPHPPYLYDENGNTLENTFDFETGYLPYLKYTNKWTLNEIKKIKNDNKDNPPVIIITGDHGMRYKPMLESNFSTFTAYYNPEQEYSHVKNSKTLINFFINFANYEFNTTFPNKKDTITCFQERCGTKYPDGTLNELNTKEVKETIDFTELFIK